MQCVKKGTKPMRWKRIIVTILAFTLMLTGPAASSLAAEGGNLEVPYQTYTYDKWGNATPAPNGYLPVKSISGTDLGIGDLLEPQDLFYCKARQEIYIVDTGNMRIIVTDETLNYKKTISELVYKGASYPLKRPTGIFVTGEGTIYIADQGNAEIIICNQDGEIQNKFGKPVSNLIDEEFDYKPNKVVVDNYGKIYVQASGVYQGLIYLKPDGSFVKFFGANAVEMTMKRIVMKLWKTILSDAASNNMQSFNPIEYGNLFMAEEGFIYATAAASENNSKLIVKLNPLGVDINNLGKPVWYSNATFTDITINENGIISVVDAKAGRIYQSDKSGHLMFAFGGIGQQLGLFKTPSAMIEVNNKLYILDSEKKNITEFGLTNFGNKVRNAISLYNSGLYKESIQPWEDVIQLNANYLLAYTGVGKAYYQLEDFGTAMKYYKLANDRGNYSIAYKEYSLLAMRNNFGSILGVVLLLIAAYKLAQFYLKKRRKMKGGLS
jgi:DNA-binding beta-propeller fold protein YncE